MEPVGASLEGEWSCLSGIYNNEEADFMAQLLGSGFGVTSAFWSTNESGTVMNHDSSDFTNISYNENLYSYSGGSSFGFYTSSDYDPVLVNNNNSSISIDFGMDDVTNYTASYLVEGINDHRWNMKIGHENVEESAQLPDHNIQPKIRTEISKPSAADKSNANPSEISKKRSKNAGNAEKTKRKARSKKSQKLTSSSNNGEECNAAGLNGPASSSCCSDDESNEFYELNGGSGSSSLSTKSTPAFNLNGKTRAGRGAATDPQSLYARKRRERINERLRILQNLVPNGTKVDISTMLEEAVQYVKFLQLQIKLLSSDDLWMYAPIAYNGMDIGLDRKLPATL